MSDEYKRKREDTEENSFTQELKARRVDHTTEMGSEDKYDNSVPLTLATFMEAMNHKNTMALMSKNIVVPIVTQLEEQISELKAEIMMKDDRIQNLELEVSNLQTKLTVVEEKLEQVEDKLELSSKENNLLFDGLKEESNENTKKIVMDLIRTKLKIDLQNYEVNEAYRVGKTNNPDKNPRRILAKFSNQGIKNRVYRQRLGLRGMEDHKQVYINEDLTKAKQGQKTQEDQKN